VTKPPNIRAFDGVSNRKRVKPENHNSKKQTSFPS